MPSALIVGTGAAAAGAALALSEHPDQQITVIDVGGCLDDAHREVVTSMAAAPLGMWSRKDREAISVQPVPTRRGSIPEKRVYGSDFPFRDFGQLEGVHSAGRLNDRVVSGAYGGYSNVWGAQVMPFNAATLAEWPIHWRDLEPHYRAVLREIPLAAQPDDLASLFPLVVKPQALPPLADRSRLVLERYELHRARLRALGVTIGRARLAMSADDCVQCGLCMTGCPYSLIYSASQTFDRLRHSGRIAYHSNLLAYRVGQRGDQAVVNARDLNDGQHHEFTADRAFLACGALGTTRLVLGSLQHYFRPVPLSESVQLFVPTLSTRATRDPRGARTFTLNQFNLLVDTQGDGVDTSLIHFYPYNPAFLESLPAPMRRKHLSAVTTTLLGRISIGLGYLPSWHSPRLLVTAKPRPTGELPELTIDQEGSHRSAAMVRRVLQTLMCAAPLLDLWPVVPLVRVSPGAKSYHFGGSFPHSASPPIDGELQTDRTGRLPQWDNIHLVDASVFPTVPATTHGLSIMANAHRIVSEAIGAGHV